MNLRILTGSYLCLVLLSIFFITPIFAKDDPTVIPSTKEIVEKDAAEKKDITEKKQTKRLTSSDKIQFISTSGNVTVDVGGKFVVENFFSNNMTTLNAKHVVDNAFFVRSTADYFFSMSYGDYDKPRIMFYDAIRFRYRWGTPTDAKNVDSIVRIADVTENVKGTATTRHLLWMREAWLKLRIGDENNDLNHYFQAGLIPYQVGRGISLGAAYEALGFLGFVPGSSIDQFAPSILLSINPIKNRLIIDAYLALTENNQFGVDSNIEVIRSNELGVGCTQRGVAHQSFIAALRADILIYEQDKKKINVEPYFVYQHAPDQDLEFKNDVNTDVGTAGLSVEGIYKRFNWGFEGAANFGEVDIRPWDRNTIVLSSNKVDPFASEVTQEYTKVYINGNIKGRSVNGLPVEPAPATKQIKYIVKASPKDASENGKEIGTVEVIKDLFIPIFNAIDRFRPEQRKTLKGYFFVADASYDIIPSDLVMSLGVGYASGEIDRQIDTNKLTTEQLLNQSFTGFIPLQSVYSGKRLRHLVLFNQGIPRFGVRNPLADLSTSNVTAIIVSDNINEMTNIAFAGARIDWKIPQLKKYKFNFSQNVIPYWIPEPSSFVVSHPQDAFVLLEESSNYLGTELTAEWSALFYDKLKFSGYFGVLIPGQHYKHMCKIPIGKGKLESGSDIAYVGNIQLSYLF